MSGARVRFAPSPTGDPHVGNIRSALFNWLLARHTGGAFILRIEDTDTAREQVGSADAIFDCLRWLGLEWDEGPGVGGPHAPYFQSQRKSIYQPFINRLIDEGQAYRCYCSRERLSALTEQQQMNKQATGYDRRCRELLTNERIEFENSGAPFTVRLKMPLEGETSFNDFLRGEIVFQNSSRSDPVLIKADGMPVYHFAHVVDDHLMNITHVLRAEEWISSTPIHVLLYRAFGWVPPIFVHLPLVLAPDRRKLGKRHGHTGTLSYRAEGYLPEALFNFLSLLGWSPGNNKEVMSRQEAVEMFSLEGLLPHGAVFDRDKLDWMNGEYIRALPLEQLFERCKPYLVAAGLISDNPDEAARDYARSIIGAVQERLKRLDQAPDMTRPFFLDRFEFDEKARKKWFDRPGSRSILTNITDRFENLSAFNAVDLEAAARQAALDYAVGTGDVFHRVRVAVSGRTEGPGLFHMLEILGRERVLLRLRKASEHAAE